MTHDVSELNQYTGAFTGACAIFLLFIGLSVSELVRTVQKFYSEYRKVNGSDRREELKRLRY